MKILPFMPMRASSLIDTPPFWCRNGPNRIINCGHLVGDEDDAGFCIISYLHEKTLLFLHSARHTAHFMG
jgi:hypothetical protein